MVWKKKKGMIPWLSRIIYGAVGVSAIASLFWMLTFAGFWDMPFWSIVAIILLIIGGLNWFVVALTGKRDMDLFGLMGL